MKIVKQLLMMAMAAAMVLCVALPPASASKYFVDSNSDSGSGLGVTWNISLSVNGQVGIAKMTVNKKTSGVIPTEIFGSFLGAIVSDKGETAQLRGKQDLIKAQSITISDTNALTNDDIDLAFCEFIPNGEEPVTLRLPNR